jgi:hypothetical protein
VIKPGQIYVITHILVAVQGDALERAEGHLAAPRLHQDRVVALHLSALLAPHANGVVLAPVIRGPIGTALEVVGDAYVGEYRLVFVRV